MLIIALSFILWPFWRASRTGSSNGGEAANHKIKWLVLGIVMLAVVCLSIMAYLNWGSSQQLSQQKQVEAQLRELDPHQVMLQLQEHLATHPNSAKGWYLLGRLYVSAGYYQQALLVFAKAYHLEPTNTEYKKQYAELLALTRGQALQNDSNNERSDNDSASEKTPEHASVLSANESVEQVDQVDEQPSQQDKKQAEQDIKQIKQGNAQALAIQVHVTLKDAMKKLVTPNDTLFIFAKAVDGPPMPLAVGRRSAHDLPLDVTLSDKNAMRPALRLSLYDRVRIIARISHSGTAFAKPGDLQGQSRPLNYQLQKSDRHITIAIVQIIKDE